MSDYRSGRNVETCIQQHRTKLVACGSSAVWKMLREVSVLLSVICAALGDYQSFNEAVFDLSYHYDNSTPHWPNALAFKFIKIIAQSDESANWFVNFRIFACICI